MTAKGSHLWGQIPLENWRGTPCTIGRTANEADVREGRAVFYINGSSQAADVALPRYAVLHQAKGKGLPVIVIQAETTDDGKVMVGYRLLSGGNGICMLSEVELLDGPD